LRTVQNLISTGESEETRKSKIVSSSFIHWIMVLVGKKENQIRDERLRCVCVCVCEGIGASSMFGEDVALFFTLSANQLSLN